MAKNYKYYIRRSHRYMGVLLGIQFLLWTIGGLYFSWTNLDEIHGDFQHKHPPALSSKFQLVTPDSVLNNLQPVDSIHKLELINILGKPFYDIAYFSGKKHHNVLADATTGAVKKPVGKDEAIQIAAASFNGEPRLKNVEYITTTHGHHEYREKPLPAWAVTFDHTTNTTVYVSAEHGKVESFRNNKWRLFDFLWMLHTMDYAGRDNFNNWLLRAFSIFGLLTIFSGFALFFTSLRKRRKQKLLAKKVIV